MKKNLLYSFASLISHVLSPLILWLVFCAYLVFVNYWFLPRYTETAILLTAVLSVFLFIIYLKKSGKISDWEMRNREERYPLYLFSISVGLIVSFLLWLNSAHYMFSYVLTIVLWSLGMGFINQYWKISGHTGTFTLVFLLSLSVSGLELSIISIFLFVLFAILLSWSRVYRKNHTLGQVVGGILLSGLIFFVAQRINLI